MLHCKISWKHIKILSWKISLFSSYLQLLSLLQGEIWASWRIIMGMGNSVYSCGPHVAVFPAKCGWKSDSKHLLTTGDCRLKYIEEILIYMLALVFLMTSRTISFICCTIGAANTPITAKKLKWITIFGGLWLKGSGGSKHALELPHSFCNYLSYRTLLECKWKVPWAVSILYCLFWV